jgi:beta-N-acetylhexosaminidase
MLSAVEHFPGLGAASQATEDGPAQVGLTLGELSQSDLVPFRAAFRAGALAVVLSHALYAMDDFTTPGSLSHKVATDLLRRRLHFGGVAITDNLEEPAITGDYSVPDASVRALRAGADMVYISGPASDQQAAYVAVLRAVQRHQLPRARLEEAVGRILQVKKRLGLIR